VATESSRPWAVDAAPSQWEAPGPGSWLLDGSHAPPNPTRMYQEFTYRTFEPGMAEAMRRFGAPLAGMQVRFIRGKFFRRLVPLVGANSNRKPPPAPVLWLATRLHPAFRQRERTARQAFGERTFRRDRDDWFDRERQEWIDKSLALQHEDPGAMEDPALADHLRRVWGHLVSGGVRHHILHGVDLGPVGDLLAHTNRWGLPAAEVASALAGASPATTECVEILGKLAAVVAEHDASPRSLDDVRALGPEATRLLDEYLALFGWRLVTSYDFEGKCLIEMPDVVLASIAAAAADARPTGDGGAAIAGLRERVPEAERAAFDRLMDDARYVYGLRDDNGPLTYEWPAGLFRRAVTEAGRRLAACARLAAEDLVWELEFPELVSLVDQGAGPDSTELARRAEERRQWADDEPPGALGPEEAPPPLGVLPTHLARGTAAVLAVVDAIEVPVKRRPLQGTGIGGQAYTGRARVAYRAEDVLATMEPGDVLVAQFTAPTYNTVLAIAGAVVTEMGGPLSHAAVMARELGIPAVIGAQGAMEIPDGSQVLVDPAAGRVSVVATTG